MRVQRTLGLEKSVLVLGVVEHVRVDQVLGEFFRFGDRELANLVVAHVRRWGLVHHFEAFERLTS